MIYLLDTNICIFLIKSRNLSLIRKFKQESQQHTIGISSISIGELFFGVEKSLYIEQNRNAIAQFLFPFETYAWDDNAAIVYGKIRHHLQKNGNIIGPYDMQIAAHAIALQAVLITDNVREFSRVPGLEVENWSRQEQLEVDNRSHT